MSNSLESLQKWKNSLEATKQINYPTEWELKRIQECVEGLFTFAKFKVGDKVKMAATYPVNEKDSWGWMAYRHLFKAGSKATIVEVEWYNKTFNYTIEFDEKSWMDSTEGKIHPSDSTHHFHISEKWLKAIK